MNARDFPSCVMSFLGLQRFAVACIMSLVVGVSSAPAQDCLQGPPFDPPSGWWAPLMDWPLQAVHMVHLPPSNTTVDTGYGKILFWNFHGSGAQLWDPSNCQFTPVPVDATIFCGGHAGLADGNVLVAGGNEASPNNLAFTFDPFTEAWTQQADMNYERFYPTCTTLPDGRILTLAGDAGGPVELGEIYKHPDSWQVLPDTSAQVLPLYPMMFLLPSGQLLSSGRELPTRLLNLQSGTWSVVTTSTFEGGSAVMYRPGVILKCGGDDFAAADESAVINMNINTTPPAWTLTEPMEFARANHNLTLLPDGTSLVTGGGGDQGQPVKNAELFNPVDLTWTTLPAEDDPRMYHSTAMLLPDGRVVSAGGNGFETAQIYWPPYLFIGPRPEILGAPSVLQYGVQFSITTPNSALIKMVSLVRLGAVTHSFDHNQLFVQLRFEVANPTTIKVKAPGTSTIAPPGYYMMFLISTEGVPSFARYVSIG
jgi:galactose oxidase